MLFWVLFLVTVSNTMAGVLDLLRLKFLTEFVVNILGWRWVVLIDEGGDDFTSLFISKFAEKNISMTIVTSQIESTIQHLLRKFGTVPVLLLLAPKVSRRNYLFETCKIQWVIIMPNSSASASLFFSESVANLNQLNAVFAVPKSEGSFILQIPRSKQNGVLKVNSWSSTTGFETSSAFARCSISSIGHLRIAMESHFPFFRPGNESHPTEGADVLLLDSLASSLSFRYTSYRPSDRAWGSRNGTEWNGMIGMLVRNEVDSALSGMTVTYERHEAVQFSVPYAFDETTFVTRRPAERAKTWAIFWPYTPSVWMTLAAVIVIMAGILTWLQTRLRKRRRRKLQFRDSLLYIFQSMLNQGYYNAKEPRCRVLMSFWWGFCITLIAGYNGNLMSFMAHPGLSPAVDTILKLVNAVRKNEIAVGTIKTSADFAMFAQSEEPEPRLILNNMLSDPRNLVHHDVEGLRECMKRNYAYIGGWLTVQADVWDPSLFLFSRDFFLQYGYAIAFRPGFEHIDIFNKKILQLQEAGIVQKWILDMIEKKQKRDVSENSPHSQNGDEGSESSENVLKVNDVQGAFAVLMIGLLAAIICFTLENYTHRKKLKKKKNTKMRRWR